MGNRCRWMLFSGALLALGALPAAAAQVLMANGQTLEVERHRVEGNAVFLYFPGGGMLAVLAEYIESIEGEALAPGIAPALPEPDPVVAPQPETRMDATPAKAASELGELIATLAMRYEVDPLLVEAVIQVESHWDPDAVSPKGAMGLMQLMPATARGHGVTDPFDPAQNVEAGVRELSVQLRNHSGEIAMALAAYNAGGRAVKRYKGIPPYPETVNYIERVLKLYFAWHEEANTASREP